MEAKLNESGKISAAVLGAGAWGTTLALHLAKRGGAISLWEFDSSRAREIERSRLSLPFVPDHTLPDNISVSSDLSSCLTGADFILVVVPSYAIRSVGESIRALVDQGLDLGRKQLVSATKGLEEETGFSASQILSETTLYPREKLVVLAGPNLSKEIVCGLPAVSLAAAFDAESAISVQKAFYSANFRIYTNPDPLGVEIGVSLKNVIAIAAGISEGLGLGQNAMGALLTRGLAEITRLGLSMGARQETFLGLAGIGDLVTTCTSGLSRNHQVGLALAKGESLTEILDRMVMVAEGVKTTRSAYQLSQDLAVEMPITEQVYNVLFDGKKPGDALEDLMQRRLREEIQGEGQ